jgi:hypothetical protein
MNSMPGTCSGVAVERINSNLNFACQWQRKHSGDVKGFQASEDSSWCDGNPILTAARRLDLHVTCSSGGITVECYS